MQRPAAPRPVAAGSVPPHPIVAMPSSRTLRSDDREKKLQKTSCFCGAKGVCLPPWNRTRVPKRAFRRDPRNPLTNAVRRKNTAKNMKLTKILAAAAVVAIGATAQAGERASDTYCVITLPVFAGYNLYGVSVAPVEGAATNWNSVIKNLPSGANLTSEGTLVSATSDNVEQLDWVWFNADADGSLYEFGLDASTESQSITVTKGAPAFYVFKKDTLTLASFSGLQTYSGKANGAKASRISIWNATKQGYDQYWYRNTGDAKTSAWYNTKTGKVDEPSSVPVPVGTAVYIQVGAGDGTPNQVPLQF